MIARNSKENNANGKKAATNEQPDFRNNGSVWVDMYRGLGPYITKTTGI
ncbi:MAG: hypothetical protein U0V74_05950 [Chitinophagales bacterium]